MKRQPFPKSQLHHQPVADHTGPFPLPRFLETWWEHLGADDHLAVVSTATGSMPLVIHEGRLVFCGDADVTDYHSPLGDTAAAITEAAAAHAGRPFSFDSLPAEASTAIGDALAAGGHVHTTEDDTVTMVIDLDDGIDGWLASMRKKDRHEARRKWRNFADALGEPRLERRDSDEAVARFAELHRASGGAKGAFMVPALERFFVDLVRRAGATVDVLIAGSDVVAAAFGFAEPDGYYLYNTAFDPAVADASPGIVLLIAMIRQLAGEGVARLDLLKGDERYKFRLGAAPRKLYRIEGRFS